jgi:hypothetical protein
LERVSRDPYDANDNPNGIIQLGLSDNKVGIFRFQLCFCGIPCSGCVVNFFCVVVVVAMLGFDWEMGGAELGGIRDWE